MRFVAQDELFPIEAGRHLLQGEQVMVQTMWGDETGTIMKVTSGNGWPLAQVAMDGGDTIYIDVARVKPLPHTRTATDVGPDYCAECSHAAQEWVTWPCADVPGAS